MQIFVREITKQKKQDMENAALLKAIIDNAIDGIITIDGRGIVESINPSACKLFLYAPEEVIGNNISKLMPPPYKDQHDEYIARFQRTRDPHIIGSGKMAQPFLSVSVSVKCRTRNVKYLPVLSTTFHGKKKRRNN
jgi:PAS domain-containing protein